MTTTQNTIDTNLLEHFSNETEVFYSFNLKEMKTVVESQDFVVVPISVMDNDNNFNEWVKSYTNTYSITKG